MVYYMVCMNRLMGDDDFCQFLGRDLRFDDCPHGWRLVLGALVDWLIVLIGLWVIYKPKQKRQSSPKVAVNSL